MRVDTTIEVTVTRQYGCCVQVTINHFFFNYRIKCTGHTVTGSTCISNDTEAQLFKFWQQARFFQIQFRNFRTRSKRRLNPRLTDQTQFIGFFSYQTRRYNVAWVRGVSTGCDCSDNNCTVWHQAFCFFCLRSFEHFITRNTTLVQRRCW